MTTTYGTKWEADQMLNAYILDYLKKKNFVQTALAFEKEAKIPTEPVLINAPEGFVLEWWSVFWDIFSARTKKPASENAKAYVERQKDRGSYSMSRTPGMVSGRASQITPLRHPLVQPSHPLTGGVPSSAAYGGVFNTSQTPVLSEPSPQSQNITLMGRDGLLSNSLSQSQSSSHTVIAGGPSPQSQQQQPGQLPLPLPGQQPQVPLPQQSNLIHPSAIPPPLPQGQMPTNQYNAVRTRNVVPAGYPNNQVNNSVPPYMSNERQDRLNRQVASQGTGINYSSPVQKANQNIFDPQSQSQGVSPSMPTGTSPPGGSIPNEQMYQDRKRYHPYNNMHNPYYISSAYPRRESQTYVRPGSESNPTSDEYSDRRGAYPLSNNTLQHPMQSQLSPVLSSQPKENDLSTNGSNATTTSNVGYISSMNNPIPNPINQQPVNPANVSMNRSGSFESDQLFVPDDGSRSDPQYINDKNRKRTRTSQNPPGSQPIPTEVYLTQRKLVANRRSPASFAFQQGSNVSPSPQGTNHTQNTPPHPSSPSQNPSPSETLSVSSIHSKNYSSPNPFYSGKNPQYPPNGYGPPSVSNPGGQAVPSPYMSYNPAQPSINYEQPPQTTNTYASNNYAFVPSMKGVTHGNANYILSSSMNPQQQKMYVNPGGRLNISGMVGKPKSQYLKNNMNHDIQVEGGDTMNPERDSAINSMGENPMLQNDSYRTISESDPIYTEQPFNPEGPNDNELL